MPWWRRRRQAPDTLCPRLPTSENFPHANIGENMLLYVKNNSSIKTSRSASKSYSAG
jgi:hypothetical protein